MTFQVGYFDSTNQWIVLGDGAVGSADQATRHRLGVVSVHETATTPVWSLRDPETVALLFDTIARQVNPASDTVRHKQILAARFRFLAEACGGSLAQMAYRFVLMHPGVSTALGGFSSLEQMEEIAAVSGLPAIPGR